VLVATLLNPDAGGTAITGNGQKPVELTRANSKPAEKRFAISYILQINLQGFKSTNHK